MNNKERNVVSTSTPSCGHPVRPGSAMLVLLAGIALLLCMSLLSAPVAHAAPRTPAWTLTANSFPTNLVPGTTSPTSPEDVWTQGSRARGPQYDFTISNTGAVISSGDITFTDVVPDGLTPVEARGSLPSQTGPDAPCTIVGQTVTCTLPYTIPPGDWARVVILLDVAADAPAAVTDHATVAGGDADQVSVASTTAVSPSTAPFDLLPGRAGLRTSITASDGSAVTQAGSHPFRLTLDTGFPTKFFQPPNDLALVSVDPVRDISTRLPPGVVVDPTATAEQCTEAELETPVEGAAPTCPPASQVGIVRILTIIQGPTPVAVPLYNMVPPPGVPAALAFDAIDFNIYVHLLGGVDASGNYALTADSNDILAKAGAPVIGVQVQLWGDPSDSSHDRVRSYCHQDLQYGLTCPVAPSHKPFLTMPGVCSGPLTTMLRADSWEQPGVFHSRSAVTVDSNDAPVGVTGCSRLDFDPSISLRPDVSVADSPSGLLVDLKIPQTDDLSSLATANLKDAVVSLPEGVSLSPSAADGLSACSPAQIGLGSNARPSCPDSSKIGTTEVITPLLKDPLEGSVYVATQNDNPSRSVLGIYVVVEGSGVVIKLAGHVQSDPVTGRLTTTFSENPQLPFSEFKLDFFGGPRAALATPDTCGSFTSSTVFSPWSGTAAKTPSDSFAISSGCGGGFSPTATSGSVNPSAGAHSDFTLRLDRADGQQHVKTVVATLPQGVLADVGSVPLCSDADAGAGTCSDASQVGTTDVSAGPGSNPFHIAGKVFLTGPYKGGPYGMAVVTRAVAGPFDLGTVVVRAAVNVDPTDAHVTVVSDDVPHILDVKGADGDTNGFPLRIRSIAVDVDRPSFVVNPTSCDPMSVNGSISSWEGATVAVSNRFQVGNCSSLAVAPKIAINLTGKGQTTDGKHPGVDATLTQAAGQANLKKVVVTLPLSLALDPDNAQALCEFTDGSKVDPVCPKGSIVGQATARTPVLNGPLTGPVYFVKNVRVDAKSGRQIKTLPKIVIPLTGPNGLRLNLVGTSSVPDNKHLVTTFDQIPDAPVSSFKLNITGGKHGILTVSDANVCKSTQQATQDVVGQNGKSQTATITMGTPCALGIVGSSHTGSSLKLTVGGIGAGKLSASGTGITKTTRTITGSTTATLTARLSPAVASRLSHHHNVTIKVTVSFTPKGAKKAKITHKTITIHAAKK